MKNVFSKVNIYSVAFILLLTLNKGREVNAFTLINNHNAQNNNRIRTTQITPTPFVLKSTTQNEVNEGAKIQKRINTSMPEHDDHGPVKPINSIASFLHAIESAPRNSIVVVQFHAKWCKVCARVIIKLRQMAQRMQTKQSPVPVSFISVEITANNEICTTLGIKKFPFVQMYRNRECVASFGTGPAHNFQPAVGGTLDEKLALSESQWEDFRSEFQNEIADGLKKFEALRLSKFYDGDDGKIDDNIGRDNDIAP